jgi:hypothetical protein
MSDEIFGGGGQHDSPSARPPSGLPPGGAPPPSLPGYPAQSPLPPSDPWAVPGSAAYQTYQLPFDAPDYPPPPRRSRVLIWLGAAVAIVLAVTAGGIAMVGTTHHAAGTKSAATSSPIRPQPSRSAGQSPATPTTPAVGADPAAGSGPLDSYLLAPAEVGAGSMMFLIDGGRSFTDQATLDFCNFDYTSETLRAARVQVQYFGGGSHPAGNEFVQYKPGGAAKGFSELQQAVAACPATWQGGGLSYDQMQRGQPDSTLAAHQLVLSYRVTDPTGGLTLPWQAVAYQFNGDYFSGVYVYGVSRALALAEALKLASQSARHLTEAVAGKPGTGGGTFASPASQPPDSGVQV